VLTVRLTITVGCLAAAPLYATVALPSVSSDSANKPKNHKDGQDDAEDAHAAVPITVTISAEATAEATEQENDDEYYENQP
jgi:hypothetical protein